MNTLRPIEPTDYDRLLPVIDDWWGGRPVSGLLQRLFFEHFRPTSFVAEAEGTLHGFLIGFRSQTWPQIAYIHFVGVAPQARGRDLGRALYDRFFETVAALGCEEVRSITSPVNMGSIAFHRAMGFELLPGTGEENGFPVVLDHAGAGKHRVCFRRCLAGVHG